ncbi:hypothetical protein FRB99_002442 [Tulasnella sp. 403]|nr:hypothetical protein FRB99_002442 [Tulasnella sp. 403]
MFDVPYPPQIYCIARVKDKYRVVAVFHHEAHATTGQTIELALAIIRGAIQPHALLIKKELACLEDVFYIFRKRAAPCPFLSGAVLSVVRKHSPTARGIAKPVIAHPLEHCNTTPIVVFDVTTPGDPAFSIVSLSDFGRFPKGTPLRTEDFAVHYIPPGQETTDGSDVPTSLANLDESTRGAVHALATFKPVPRHVLNALWPGSIFADAPSLSPKQDPSPPGHAPLSLSLLSLRVACTAVLQSGDNEAVNSIAASVHSSHVAGEVLQTARQAELPDIFVPLLIAALRVTREDRPPELNAELDLTGYRLKPDQLVQVVKSFPEAEVETLDLSANPHLTSTSITDVMKARSAPLKRLILFNTRMLLQSDMETLRSQRVFGTTEVFHSSLLNAALRLHSHDDIISDASDSDSEAEEAEEAEEQRRQPTPKLATWAKLSSSPSKGMARSKRNRSGHTHLVA